MKPLSFLGSALHDIRSFPPEARRAAGYQLFAVQGGRDPSDWKPMSSVGAGVREIRIRDEAGAFRVMYVASLPEAVYVLHAFQKKTAATSKRDLAIARQRLLGLMRSR